MRKAVKNEIEKLRYRLKTDIEGQASLIILEDLLSKYEVSKHHKRVVVPKKRYSSKQYETYAIGINKLRLSHKAIFTSKDNLEARLKDNKLFDGFQDSSTAIIYDGEFKFKIDLKSKDLIKLDKTFSEPSFFVIDYQSSPGIELDRRNSIYNRALTKNEFLKHEGWNVLFGGDEELKKKFVNTVYSEKSSHYKACAFMLKNNAEKGEIIDIVLCSQNHKYPYAAEGSYDDLDKEAYFIEYGIRK